ncbi:MAG: hypothetical protein KTM48_03575, partial [Wolbachia endosymbiont of Pissodes strobi]|nr:hypothetical protein [Wolbachia endosymbiont of Pissodes strobi]
ERERERERERDRERVTYIIIYIAEAKVDKIGDGMAVCGGCHGGDEAGSDVCPISAGRLTLAVVAVLRCVLPV